MVSAESDHRDDAQHRPRDNEVADDYRFGGAQGPAIIG
jgi:hypothetical protein